MRFAVHLTSLACAAVLTACAAASQHVYVAPTRATVRFVVEERDGPQQAHDIYIENHSTVPITVFSMSLRRCENVGEPCDAQQVNLRVRPNGRLLAMTVDPADPQHGFSYAFDFSWHADSSSDVALAALTRQGDPGAGARLAAMQRTDAERASGVGYTDLGAADYSAIAGQAWALRAVPESLVMTPGQRTTLDRIHLVLIDSSGRVLGRTHFIHAIIPAGGAIQVVPPDNLVARRPGRTVVRYMLRARAQAMLTHQIAPIEVPLVVAFPLDPHAPVFGGRAMDADSRTPLRCARVALEDSAKDVVARGQTGTGGSFALRAPRPGTYRVRVEMRGFVPSYGPFQNAVADEDKQGEYLVRFTDQLLLPRSMYETEFQHAEPASVRVDPSAANTTRRAHSPEAAAPVVQGVTLGGSETMPILGILWHEPPTTTWAEFVVDSAGGVDSMSILLPQGTSAAARADIARVLPNVRFTPARDNDRPVCELLRMQVEFSRR